MTRVELRDYQSEAIQAIYDALGDDDGCNPCAVLPTGAGKTVVLATMARDVLAEGGRVVILSHVRELLQQAADTLGKWCPELQGRIGIHSAGLKSRDTEHDCLIAGIQSVYKRGCDIGPVDLCIVDEAHLIPANGEGRYNHFLEVCQVNNPHLRVCGLTATPYRLTSGTICGDGQILDRIACDIGVRRLIDDGWLCPLISKAGDVVADTDNLHVASNGDFVTAESNAAMEEILDSATDEIVELTSHRMGTLVFAPSVAYGKLVTETLADKLTNGVVAEIYGETDATERAEIIAAFKRREITHLVNRDVLTTGFDATHVDCVALLRPTLSPGLYAQIIGRGLRIHPDKSECLVLDFAGNVMRHGPVDDITPPERKGNATGEPLMKECPECGELHLLHIMECPCGFIWPKPEPKAKHEEKATTLPILSQQDVTNEWCNVQRVQCYRWEKRDDPTKPPTLRVDYYLNMYDRVSEWVCFEHTGFARDKAIRWWKARSEYDVPDTVDEALEAINQWGAIAETTAVCVRKQAGRYPEIKGHDIGKKPVPEKVPF